MAPAAVHQLPRGRHRLTRAQVLASQRGRMLAAIAAVVADKGFARTTVADVIARAGVSRETFYEQFSDKEECFLAALDIGVEGLLEILGAALSAPSGDPLVRLDRALQAYLDALVAEPQFAKTFLVEAYGAGPRAIERRVALQQRFVDTVAGIFGAADAPPGSPERFACEALVAAVSSLVTARVATGRIGELLALRVPLIDLAGRVGLAAPARRATGRRA